MAGYLRRLSPYRRVGGYISGGTASQPGSYPTTTSAVWSLDDLYLRRVGPLLDNYPNAAAAYSLRSLTSAYTGPVITVRRSSDSAEADFTATEVADGTLEAWCGAGDGLVKTLYDQSGHGRHASQSTATAQPKIVSGGVLVLENGLPAIEFDGSNDYLANTTHNWAVQPTDNLFALCVASPQSTGMTIAASRDYAGTLSYKGWQWRLDASTNYMRILNYNGSVADSSLSNYAPTLNDQSLLVARLASSGDHGVFANGSNVETSSDDSLTAYTPATDDLLVGAVGIIGGTISDYFDGTIQELIIYPVDQSANRVAIEDNINDHYNVFDPTVLLLHMDGTNGSRTFTDSSLNNFTVTANGDAQISTAQSKFGGASLVSGTLAGSNYLEVSGDPGGFGTADFTVEAWFMQSGVSTTPTCRFFSAENHVLGGNRAYVYIDIGKLQFAVFGTVFLQSDTLTWNDGQWYHVAYSRSNGQLRAYRDGQLVAEVANTTNLASDSSWRASADATGQYIDDLRITKGRALYTANFTPPTQAHPDPVPADPYFNQVSLLLPMDGADGSNTFVDKSKNAFAVTPYGDASISTAVSKFGGASGAFDGTGDYLAVANSTEFDIDGDYTIEMWFYQNSSGNGVLWSRGGGAYAWNATNGYYVMLYVASGDIKFEYYTGSGPGGLSATVPDSAQWHHVAIARSSGTFRMFLNGVLAANVSTAIAKPSSVSITRIGSDQANTITPLNGYIDDLRITNGIARYTSTFTPPTAPHPHL